MEETVKPRRSYRLLIVALAALAVVFSLMAYLHYSANVALAEGEDAELTLTVTDVNGVESGSVLVRTEEDGSSSYSTDDGATWTEGLPDGAYGFTTEDGQSFVIVGAGSEGADAYLGVPDGATASLAVRTEDGVTYYSSDGGSTWSETPPDDVEVSVGSDGSVSVRGGAAVK
ncbi:MAG: glycoside hydrolase [Coriobacteriales bacterium]|nr:glycoside hydrolase [Coriobacteriales bacterium]